MPSAVWLPQQLAEFLAAVTSYNDPQAATQNAVERAAEAVEAEVGAFVRGGFVVTSLGYPAGRTPVADLLAAVDDPTRALDVPGVGRCEVLCIPLEDAAGMMLFARSGAAFSREEASLLRGMGRVLSLSLRMLAALADERELRKATQRQAQENAALLQSLQARQRLLERLFEIQRSISHRAPTQEVLDAICSGASELLGDEVVGLRLVDEDEPGWVQLVSVVGVSDEVVAGIRRSRISEGIGGRSISEGRLVITEDYTAPDVGFPELVEDGLHTAMGAPVFRDSKVVGSLVVASRNPARRYAPAEQDALLVFAEHASLALNDASALDSMKNAFAQAVHQAHHDPLTGLPNRTLVLDRLDQAIAGARGSRAPVVALFIDLDRFKTVNDSLGHSVGDEVLVCVAERLRAAIRPSDTVGRLAGDEFIVICQGVEDIEVMRIAQRILDTVAEPLPLYGREAVITASIGIAHARAGSQADDIVRDADVAMYRAKELGRSRIEVFDQAMRSRILRQLETEHELRRGIQQDELVLHFQPIVATTAHRLLGFEALVRWRHPVRGLVGPDEFIHVAEETGLILPIGRWVLFEACRQTAAWRAEPGGEDLGISVNLSSRQFADPNLAGLVGAALEEAGLPADALTLEITEGTVMEDTAPNLATLQALKDLKVRLSIDDFGTGYSSLSYLKRFPIDTLKIDRGFVDGVVEDGEDKAIVGAIVGLAAALGLEVVAEGVETEAQLAAMAALGCAAVQGHLFGTAVPAGDVDRSRALLLATPRMPVTVG